MKILPLTLSKHLITAPAALAIAALMVPAAPAAPLHHWRMAEVGSGGIAADTGSSGIPANATLQGGVYPQTGGYLEFDGNSGHLDLGESFTFAATNGFTFSAWAKFDSLDYYQTVLSLCDSDGDNMIHLLATANNGMRFGVGTNGAFNYLDTLNYSLNQDIWTHIVATSTSAGTMKLYLDGITLATDIDGIAPNPSLVTYPYAALGRDDAGYALSPLAGDYLHGGLRDARIYDRALSQVEVDMLYNNGQGGELPEPSSLALFIIGGMAMTGYRWQRRRQINGHPEHAGPRVRGRQQHA